MAPRKLLWFLLLLISANIHAQTPGLQWQRALGGTKTDWVRTIAQDIDGNFFIGTTTQSSNGDAGCTYAGAADLANIWVTKISPSGRLLWQRCYGGSKGDECRRIVTTSDGGMLLAGYVASTDGDISGNHGSSDIWLAKLDAAGNIQWQRCYGGSGTDELLSLAKTSDGGYIFAGLTTSSDGDVTGGHNNAVNREDAWVAKITAGGVIEWAKCFGGTSRDGAHNIIQNSGGGYTFLGFSASADGDLVGHVQNWDVWIVELDQAGQITWQKTYGGTGADHGYSLLELADGGYVIAADTRSNNGDVSGNHNPGTFDVWLLKINDAGQIVWQRCYGGSFDEGWPVIGQALDDNYVFGSYSTSVDGDITGHHGAFDISDTWLVKIDQQNGNILWSGSFGGNGGDGVRDLLVLADGTYLVVGDTGSSDGDVQGWHGDADAWVIKVGPVNTIKGMVFVDANANGIKDVSEKYYTGLVVSEKNGFTYTNQLVNGRFINNVDTGSYTTRVLFNPAYYTSNPASFASNYTNYTNVDSFTFALVPIPGAKDLSVTLIPVEDARPGFQTDYRIHYKNKGVDPVNASVRFKRDARTNFISSSIPVSSIINDTLIWTLNNLQPLDSGTIHLTLHVSVPPTVNVNDTLKHDCVIYPLDGDVIPADNHSPLSQVVVGAVDPNDKTEAHAGKIKYALVLAGEQLNYVIRFQNTGTASAINVVIRDTLSDKVNLESFEMLSASHAYTLSIKNGHLEWTFRNIYLPDSNVNEPASHGYVAFRIKPKTTLLTGDIIPNTASIYFDYNLPVQTNTENTFVINNAVLPVKLSQFEGILKNNVVHLSWKTATEQGTKLFEVERSVDGLKYENIGAVNAKNIGNGAAYSFIDLMPSAGYNYYRLKIIDTDGKYVYSGIVIIQVKSGGELTTRLYPNPSSDGNVSINIYGSINGVCTIDVLDMNGRQVLKKNLGSIKAEGYSTMLRLAGLQKGVYTLRLSVAGSIAAHQFVIR